MKPLNQQLKDLAKNIEKHLNKELSKKKIRIPIEEQIMTNILDSESEIMLKLIIDSNKPFNQIMQELFYKDGKLVEDKEIDRIQRIIRGLELNGFISSVRWIDGGFPCYCVLEQKGSSYFEMKEHYMGMLSQPNIQCGNYNDFKGANLSQSNNQIGNINSHQNLEITPEMIEESIQEIHNNIEKYGLSESNKQELKDLLEDLKEKNHKKQNLAIRALKGIWSFSKEVCCGLLTAYLSSKFGFTQ